MANSIITYVRLTKREREIIECLKERMGVRSMAEVIRMLLYLGLNALDNNLKSVCMASR